MRRIDALHALAGGAALADPTLLDYAEVARACAADIDHGLSSPEAALRLARDGPNTLPSAPAPAFWRRFLAHFQDPLIYLLLAAVLISLVAWVMEGRGGWPVDAIVIGLVILLNAILGFLQESKAQDAVAALSKMTAPSASVMRDGHLMLVPSATLTRGDILVLAEGDAVAADARLLRATSLRVDEASLTGESSAVLKDAATLVEAAALGDRSNMVFMGTTVVQGSGRAIVTACALATEMGAIAGMLTATEEPPTPLEQEVGRIGRKLGIAVVLIAVVVVGTTLLMSNPRGPADVMHVLLLGVSLAVAAVPEGLPAILSVVLALGVQRMARHQALVKKLASVETLGSASVIATDKTGTLTRAQMTIERMITASGETRVTGVGYQPQGRVEHEGAVVTVGAGTDAATAGALAQETVVLLGGGSLAGNAALHRGAAGEWEQHGDPTEVAFLVAEHKLGGAARRAGRFERVGEIGFTSERKFMSVLAQDAEHDNARVLVAKGAPDVLLGRCDRERVGMRVVALDAARRAAILAGVDRLSDAALRTLSVAYRPLGAHETALAEDLERDLIFVGTVGMLDPPRAEAGAAIELAQRAGIRVIMITGDHPRTAARIAADLHIAPADQAALSGAQLDELGEEAFAAAVRSTSVYARVSPAHKLRIVGALRKDGNVVAMTGDGVNDAPALKAADIGIAMGITGTEVSKAAAKMILADDNFATIVKAVGEGRVILENIRKCLRYLLSSNMGEVLTVFLGVLGARVFGLAGADGAIALPLLATQLLWINLVTDSGPALALGVDPPIDDQMARRPRAMHAPVLDARMWRAVVQTGLVIALVTLLTMDMYLPGGLIEGDGDLVTARTAGFTVLVLTSLFTCLTVRSDTGSAFAHLSGNPWLWRALAVSLALQVAVVHVPALNVAFGTAPLGALQWAQCAAMASVVLWFSEAVKLARRAAARRR